MNRRKLATGAHHHFSVAGSHGGLQPGQSGRLGIDQAGKTEKQQSHWLHWKSTSGDMELLWTFRYAEATLSGNGQYS